MLRQTAAILVTILSISGCDPGGIWSTGGISSVEVEGMSMHVQPFNEKPNAWASAPADLNGGRIDPNIYRLNVLAIEAVSGCSVDPVTVVNQGLQTIAVVSC